MILDDRLKILHCSADLGSVHTSPNLVCRKSIDVAQCYSSEILEKVTSLCCTVDQRNALQACISVLKRKCSRSVLSLTSARGRGKSATLGLAISSALFCKYSRVYVTSPQVENLQTLFRFIVNGLKAFGYKEEIDYNIIYIMTGNQKLISGMNIFHDQKQIVSYVSPTEFFKIGPSDLIVIDEAAAIPLPVVKKWLKSDLVFMASTVNGYEGTGRSLSLKLMNQLREESQHACNGAFNSSDKTFTLHEVTLNEPIRYANGDSVEAWLNELFCLDAELSYLSGVAPDPEQCQLYYVNKKVLFSYQNVAEKFLQQLTTLFVSSHYKNSPNDLFMMADAPSHHLFCLLPPVDKKMECIPDVLCAIQVALEGKISQECIIQELSHGKRASGDLIPWIISQQFQDDNFPSLSGARVVRIATHPNIQRMGYGQRALRLLFSYYERNSESNLTNSDFKSKESTLLLSLEEIEQNKLDYIGVSYGLTLELLKFWKKLDFVPLYLRQTASETTGEHSCIMIRKLGTQMPSWLSEYLSEFLLRFITFLTSAFKNLPAHLALEILNYKKIVQPEIKGCLIDVDIYSILTTCSIKRLEAYCNHLVDYHLIMDLMPTLARCYFYGCFKSYFLSSIQEIVLLSMSFQNKSIEEIADENSMETNQVMGIFMKTVRKILHHISSLNRNFKPEQKSKIKDLCDKNTQNSYCKELKHKRKDGKFMSKKRKEIGA